jgi:hypothetical protein
VPGDSLSQRRSPSHAALRASHRRSSAAHPSNILLRYDGRHSPPAAVHSRVGWRLGREAGRLLDKYITIILSRITLETSLVECSDRGRNGPLDEPLVRAPRSYQCRTKTRSPAQPGQWAELRHPGQDEGLFSLASGCSPCFGTNDARWPAAGWSRRLRGWPPLRSRSFFPQPIRSRAPVTSRAKPAERAQFRIGPFDLGQS